MFGCFVHFCVVVCFCSLITSLSFVDHAFRWSCMFSLRSLCLIDHDVSSARQEQDVVDNDACIDGVMGDSEGSTSLYQNLCADRPYIAAAGLLCGFCRLSIMCESEG